MVIFNVHGMNVARAVKLEDGNYDLLARELQLYLDPVTNEVLHTWYNPDSETNVTGSFPLQSLHRTSFIDRLCRGQWSMLSTTRYTRHSPPGPTKHVFFRETATPSSFRSLWPTQIRSTPPGTQIRLCFLTLDLIKLSTPRSSPLPTHSQLPNSKAAENRSTPCRCTGPAPRLSYPSWRRRTQTQVSCLSRRDQR